jgi:Fe-S-cluster-containing dehydrogenase component/formate-dependent nitrite reductase membrane component NrfD
VRYGFAIDNRTCIGCHACSVACKAENDVPLGVHRTWVKTVEFGEFPNSGRAFQVTRCNHCANPPCVRICPVTAMYQRHDGIVDFDPDICIGCKACLQACPYDAIHIDPRSGTAAKCHFCAHRVEVGLEPACVIVCPTHSIVAGDLDDATSDISVLLGSVRASVRRPEQGTSPNVFYVEGRDVTLDPAAARAPGTYAASDLVSAQSGVASTGPLRSAGVSAAATMVQVAFNAQHRVPWHWPVPAYLVTKAVAAGVPLALTAVLALVSRSGAPAPGPRGEYVVYALVALAALGLTLALLVLDLERPERFLSILRRPQWRSWLTRGAFILLGYSVLLGLWAGLELGALREPSLAAARPGVLAAVVVGAAAAAAYTGFLFAQAEGRDLWQSRLLPAHLVLQAALAGAATLTLIQAAAAIAGLPDPPAMAATLALLGATLVADAAAVLWEMFRTHARPAAAAAALLIRAGRYRLGFWGGAILAGHAVPLALVAAAVRAGDPTAASATMALAAGAALALAGLYAYEHAFVAAPQELPNS